MITAVSEIRIIRFANMTEFWTVDPSGFLGKPMSTKTDFRTKMISRFLENWIFEFLGNQNSQHGMSGELGFAIV